MSKLVINDLTDLEPRNISSTELARTVGGKTKSRKKSLEEEIDVLEDNESETQFSIQSSFTIQSFFFSL